MKIKINADVKCGEKPSGNVSCLIFDPLDNELTHLVVTEKHFPLPPNEYLVSLKYVVKADNETVNLDCTPDELSKRKTSSNMNSYRAD